MNLDDTIGLQVLHAAEEDTQGWKMLIGGEWVASRSGKRFASVNPAYDEAIAEVPAANADDIQAAVDAAKAAFPAWSKLHVDERVEHCKQFAQAVIQPRDTRIRLIQALEMFRTKKEERPPKKHGTMPL